MERDSIQNHVNDLAAAGFVVLPATTPERQAMLATLPPNRVSQRIEGEHVSYLYPDPVLCHCLYVGGQDAFARFRAVELQRQITRDQLEAAQLNNNFMWDWGPWGGYGYRYY
jgi:hypothetical protein